MLSQSALDLELALRELESPDIEACIDAVDAFLEPLLADIRLMVDGVVKTPAPVEIDHERAVAVLQQLEALLALDDTRASQVWRDHEPLIRAVTGSSATLLGREIERFEYDKALQTLRATKKSLG
jgi:hypothetical protein